MQLGRMFSHSITCHINLIFLIIIEVTNYYIRITLSDKIFYQQSIMYFYKSRKKFKSTNRLIDDYTICMLFDKKVLQKLKLDVKKFAIR